MTEPPQYYRPVRATFRPRFALSLLYLFVFFFLFAMALVIPMLVETYQNLPQGTDEEQLAIMREVAREIIQPRLWVAIAASILATALGAHRGLLPGLRR